MDLQALHKLGKPRLIHCSAVDAPGLDRLTLAANTRGDNCVPDRAVTEEFHLHECFVSGPATWFTRDKTSACTNIFFQIGDILHSILGSLDSQ
jgi:hypothetical protein